MAFQLSGPYWTLTPLCCCLVPKVLPEPSKGWCALDLDLKRVHIFPGGFGLDPSDCSPLRALWKTSLDVVSCCGLFEDWDVMNGTTVGGTSQPRQYCICPDITPPWRWGPTFSSAAGWPT